MSVQKREDVNVAEDFSIYGIRPISFVPTAR